jgi:hypothetical protein
MDDTLLRRAALADGLASLAVAGLLIAGAPFLARPLGMEEGYLVGAGWVVLPFVLAWFYVAVTASRPLARAGVFGNVVWAAASAIAVPILQPTALGAAFIAVQAATVLALAYFQNRGLQRLDAVA